MAATPQDLFSRLEGLGISYTTREHQAVFTVQESKELRGALPGGHCKNLFLKDKKGQLWLVVALEDRSLDTKKLRHVIGASHLSFGNPELLQEVLGVEPGAVTPFGLMNDTDHRVRIVLDKEMLEHDPLNYHPLTNTATTAISAQDLIAFIEACGHSPLIVDLAPAARDAD